MPRSYDSQMVLRYHLAECSLLPVTQAQMWQVSFFFSIFIIWEFPVPKGQLELSVRAFYNRCKLCNQTFAIMDLMLILSNTKYKFCLTICVFGSRIHTEVNSRFPSRNDTLKYKMKCTKILRYQQSESKETIENEKQLVCTNHDFWHKSEVPP